MKTQLVFSALVLATAGASAQNTLVYPQTQAPVVQQAPAPDMARVISSTPVIQQVAIPRQVCSLQQVAVPQQKSGGGAVVGALAGGAIGNAMGQGSGNAAATILGIMGGAILGNNLEGDRGSQVQTQQVCNTQTFYENRAVAFTVVYEYGGRQYTTQMQQDPGPYIRVQVTPVGSATTPEVPQAAYTSPSTYVQSVVVEPTYVVAEPVYRPYYPPAGVSLNFGYVQRNGHRGHHPGHRGYQWR